MTKKHRWDKSKRSTWPLVCYDCGTTGRVKEGTVGTMEYKIVGSDAWVRHAPCIDPFKGCCGGSDESPPEHTQDCPTREASQSSVHRRDNRKTRREET